MHAIYPDISELWSETFTPLINLINCYGYSYIFHLWSYIMFYIWICTHTLSHKQTNTHTHTHTHSHTFIPCLSLQGRCLEAAFLFAILLNLKHIFLYMAPAYFVYLLKHYCFAAQTDGKNHAPKMKDFLLKNFIRLGSIVIAVFVISFGPFIYMVSD